MQDGQLSLLGGIPLCEMDTKVGALVKATSKERAKVYSAYLTRPLEADGVNVTKARSVMDGD